MMNTLKHQWLRITVHVGSLIPLAVLIWSYFNQRLGVNPIREMTLRTGKTALILLTLSLACTPVNTLLGFKPALKVRRALGLYAFLYAAVHLFIFVGLDYGFDPAMLQDGIMQNRYVLVGLAAFVILLALAITSTKGWMRRLGQLWKKLHQWVYVAALLVIVHFVWLVKADVREPLTYGAIVLALVLMRVPHVRQRVSAIRGRITARARSKSWPGLVNRIASRPDSKGNKLRLLDD